MVSKSKKIFILSCSINERINSIINKTKSQQKTGIEQQFYRLNPNGMGDLFNVFYQ